MGGRWERGGGKERITNGGVKESRDRELTSSGLH
jgi:hypothetical protein